MATVVIQMTPEFGVTQATTALAVEMRRRGHRVIYLTDTAISRCLKAKGFEVEIIPTAPLALPPEAIGPSRGILRTGAVAVSAIARIGPGRFHRIASVIAQRAEALSVRASRIRSYNVLVAARIARLDPDVALLDVIRPWACIPFLRRSVPIIIVNPSFAGALSTKYPPAFSSRVPRNPPTLVDRLRNFAEWRVVRRMLVLDLTTWCLKFPLAGFNLLSSIWQAKGNLCLHEYGLRVRSLELVVMPQAVDWPAATKRPLRHYLGTAVHAEEDDASFDWTFLRPGRPLLYCAFGMMVSDTLLEGPVRHVVDAFRDRSDWDVLVSASHGLRERMPYLPHWIHLRRPVPQQGALRRAKVFITHAGGASLREAVFAGVAMVAIPFRGCEIGHAARIVYHNLGRRAEVRRLDSETVARLVDEVASDTRIATAMRDMRVRYRQQLEIAEVASLVEQVAASRGSAQSRHQCGST